MKSLMKIMMVILFLFGTSNAQFRSDAQEKSSVSSSLLRSDNSGLLFGWFNPDRLFMHQSYSFSYTTSGGKGFSLGMYTNSLLYQISDPLSVQVDVSLLHSPFNNVSDNFAKDISGLYLTRAQLNYRPSDNMLIQLQYRQLPMYWLNNFSVSNFFYGVDDLTKEEEH